MAWTQSWYPKKAMVAATARNSSWLEVDLGRAGSSSRGRYNSAAMNATTVNASMATFSRGLLTSRVTDVTSEYVVGGGSGGGGDTFGRSCKRERSGKPTNMSNPAVANSMTQGV